MTEPTHEELARMVRTAVANGIGGWTTVHHVWAAIWSSE